MKKIVLLTALVLLSIGLKAQQQNIWNETAEEKNERLSWWTNDRFGLFIHWGLYSQTAGYWEGRRAKSSGHIMFYEQIPVKVWGELAHDFNPTKFNANEWVLAAKNAGMKYIVITTKHHDGLAMYNSESSDYDLQDKSPFKRDPIKELADACHKHEIKLGFYYSLGRDWEDPNAPTKVARRSNTWDYPDEAGKVFNKYFERKVKPQITELVTQYGDVAILWFDTPGLISKEESMELKTLVRTHQPQCIINSRIGNRQGDYSVKEQKIGEVSSEPWESCITMARHWNYDLDEKDEYKSPELLIHQLLKVVSSGGNYLLNVGPKPDGTLTEESLVRLESIGEWMNINSEGIYGTLPWKVGHEDLTTVIPERMVEYPEKRGIEGKDAVNDATSKAILSEVRFTTKGKNVYAFIFRWNQEYVLIKSLATGKITITDVNILGSEESVKWSQSDNGASIKLPVEFGNSDIPVICVKITHE